MTSTIADVVELKLPPDPKYIAVVRLTVAGFASRGGMSVDDVDDLKVAVCETFTNTIDHAFEGADAKAVLIKMHCDEKQISVEVIDEGVGFDVASVNMDKKAAPSEQGGLGLYLVHQYMDVVKVESAPGSGTRVIMTKRLAR